MTNYENPTYWAVVDDKKKEFRRFYENKQRRKLREVLAEQINEDVDLDDLLNTNQFKTENPELTLAVPQNIPTQFMPQFEMGSVDGSAAGRGAERGAAREQIPSVQRKKKTVVNVDSRHRDTTIYPNANHFRPNQ